MTKCTWCYEKKASNYGNFEFTEYFVINGIKIVLTETMCYNNIIVLFSMYVVKSNYGGGVWENAQETHHIIQATV